MNRLWSRLFGGVWDNPTEREKASLQGKWKAVATRDVPGDELNTLSLTIKYEHIFATFGQKEAVVNYKLVPGEFGPRQIDFIVTRGPKAIRDKTYPGIYFLDGDTLKLLFRDPGLDRPERDEPGVRMVLLKREKS